MGFAALYPSYRAARRGQNRGFVSRLRRQPPQDGGLREKLIAEGIDASALDRVKAPAGLDLGAITPEEIAMSILAEITLERRRGQRGAGKRS
jgi:hypothetical protein